MGEHISIPALQNAGNKALDQIIELQSQLEAEKAARLAAEMALSSFQADFKTSEMSTLAVATRMLARIGKLDLTAAQEALRKAAEHDEAVKELRSIRPFADAYVAVTAQLDIANNIIGHVQGLRAERDGLLAMVEAKQKALKLTQEAILEQTNDWPYDLRYKQVCDASSLTPANALEACQEVCICSAVYSADGGYLMRGQRHHDCIKALHQAGYKTSSNSQLQGFITSRNRFVSRAEGLRLQKLAGVPSADGEYRNKELFSEDLY